MAIFVGGELLSEKPSSTGGAHEYTGAASPLLRSKVCRSPLECRTKKTLGTFGDHFRSLTAHVAFSAVHLEKHSKAT